MWGNKAESSRVPPTGKLGCDPTPPNTNSSTSSPPRAAKGSHWGGTSRSSGYSAYSASSAVPPAHAECSYQQQHQQPQQQQQLRPDQLVAYSKRLSWLLRHSASKEGLHLSSDGFVSVSELLRRPDFRGLTLTSLQRLVAEDSKQRYTLRCDSTVSPTKQWYIRANQGHSVDVPDLQLTRICAPDEAPVAIHGTTYRAWKSIKVQGLSRMTRQHIHFAPGLPGAGEVISGMRSTSEVYVYLDVGRCLREGVELFRSANNVILTPGKHDPQNPDTEGFLPPDYFLKVVDAKTMRPLT